MTGAVAEVQFFILKLVSVGEGGVNSRILKVGVQLCFVEGIGISMSIVIASWLKIWRLWPDNYRMLRLVAHTK